MLAVVNVGIGVQAMAWRHGAMGVCSAGTGNVWQWAAVGGSGRQRRKSAPDGLGVRRLFTPHC